MFSHTFFKKDHNCLINYAIYTCIICCSSLVHTSSYADPVTCYKNQNPAVYDTKNRTVFIPAVDVPILDVVTGLPTGQLAVFSLKLNQVAGVSDFQMDTNSVKFVEFSTNYNPDHARYDYQKSLFSNGGRLDICVSIPQVTILPPNIQIPTPPQKFEVTMRQLAIDNGVFNVESALAVQIGPEKQIRTLSVSPELYAKITEWLDKTKNKQTTSNLSSYLRTQSSLTRRSTLDQIEVNDLISHFESLEDDTITGNSCVVLTPNSKVFMNPSDTFKREEIIRDVEDDGKDDHTRYAVRDSFGAISSLVTHAYSQGDIDSNVQIDAPFTSSLGKDYSTHYTKFEVTNLCLNKDGFETKEGCPLAVEYYADYQARLHSESKSEFNETSANGNSSLKVTGIITSGASGEQPEMIFNPGYQIYTATQRDVEINSKWVESFFISAGTITLAIMTEKWELLAEPKTAESLAYLFSNQFSKKKGNSNEVLVHDIATESPSKPPKYVEPNNTLEFKVSSALAAKSFTNGSNPWLASRKPAYQHNRISSNAVMMAVVKQKDVCLVNQTKLNYPGSIFYHVGALNAVNEVSWGVTEPTRNIQEVANHFKQHCNAMRPTYSNTIQWSNACNDIKNKIVTSNNGKGDQGFFILPSN